MVFLKKPTVVLGDFLCQGVIDQVATLQGPIKVHYHLSVIIVIPLNTQTTILSHKTLWSSNLAGIHLL